MAPRPGGAAAAGLLLGAATLLQGCDKRHPNDPGEDAKLFLLSGFPDARCLDGSPGAYYYRKASDSQSAGNWVIGLEGGGECTTDVTCQLRKIMPLGSSKSYPPTNNADMPQFTSNDPAINPDMAGWNHVRVKYCTGDLHLGTMNATDQPEWGWARFAGARIVDAVLQDLQANFALSDAQEIVWTGESAGGIASVAWLDEVADRFPKAKVVGAPIAGYYWDDKTVYTGPGAAEIVPFGIDGFKVLHALFRMFVPRRCAAGPLSETPWACGLAHFSFPTLVSPIFVSETQIDYIQLGTHAGAWCDPSNPDFAAQEPFCLEWGRNMTARLQQVADRARADPSKAALFTSACRIHTEFSFTNPKVNDTSYIEAFGLWRRSQGTVIFEDTCCAGDKIAFNPTCPKLGLLGASDANESELVV